MRAGAARFAAPAAFLLAATVAVLLIRNGLDRGGSTQPTTTAGTTTEAEQFYTVQSGDTLGGIALQFNTSVSQLLELNPGIDPRALHSGQRVRVG